jgi:hypothetical protein
MAEDSSERFRADPAKVRVSIRAIPGGWRVCVWPLGSMWCDMAEGANPEETTTVALHRAAKRGVKGINLGMGRAYPHPQKGASCAS